MMNRATHTIFAGLLCLAAPLSAQAQDADAKKRFDSDDFLLSLDLLIAQQMSKEGITGVSDAQKALDPALFSKESNQFSLRQKDDKSDKRFIYLSDFSKETGMSQSTAASGIDFASLMAGAPNDLFGASRQSLYAGKSRVGFQFASPEDAAKGPKGFELALQSAFNIDRNLSFSDDDYGILDKEYNVGLTFGYSGFNLDANIIQQEHVFAPNFSGIDVGFSYRTNKFWTRLGLSELVKDQDLFTENLNADNIMTLELGAGYRFSNRFSVSGGLRYSDFDQTDVSRLGVVERAQMVFLGTRLDF